MVFAVDEKYDKTKSPVRWIILILACLMLIGSYYCFDIPASCKTQLDDFMGDPKEYETYFSLFYTLYSTPNTLLPFFGGYFVDMFGVRTCLLVFTTLIMLGQIIFAFGLSIKSWPILFLGRLVFGLGGESLIVANSALLADWFKGKELAFAFGINLSVARVGSVVNNLVSPAITKADGVVFANWFGAFLCAASVICVIITIPLDKAAEMKQKLTNSNPALLQLNEDNQQHRIDNITEDQEGWNTVNSPVKENKYENNVDRGVSFADALSFTKMFWLLVVLSVVVYGCVLPFNNVASSLLLERNYFQATPSDCTLTNINVCESSDNQPIAACPTSKWFEPPLPSNVNITGQGYYPGPLSEDDIDCTNKDWSGKDTCTYIYCDRLAEAESQSALIMSIPYIISGVLSPIIGYLVDLYGNRATIAAVAVGFLIFVHFSLGFSDMGPVVPLVGQGLAYTGFAAVLWPAIPLVVEERLIGLGFGVATSLQNLGCAVIPLLVAQIYSLSGNLYIPNVELLFGCLGIIGFLVALYVNYEDYYYYDSILNKAGIVDEIENADVKEKLLIDVDECDEKSNSRSNSTSSNTNEDRKTSFDRARFRSVEHRKIPQFN